MASDRCDQVDIVDTVFYSRITHEHDIYQAVFIYHSIYYLGSPRQYAHCLDHYACHGRSTWARLG